MHTAVDMVALVVVVADDDDFVGFIVFAFAFVAIDFALEEDSVVTGGDGIVGGGIVEGDAFTLLLLLVFLNTEDGIFSLIPPPSSSSSSSPSPSPSPTQLESPRGMP